MTCTMYCTFTASHFLNFAATLSLAGAELLQLFIHYSTVSEYYGCGLT